MKKGAGLWLDSQSQHLDFFDPSSVGLCICIWQILIVLWNASCTSWVIVFIKLYKHTSDNSPWRKPWHYLLTLQFLLVELGHLVVLLHKEQVLKIRNETCLVIEAMWYRDNATPSQMEAGIKSQTLGWWPCLQKTVGDGKIWDWTFPSQKDLIKECKENLSRVAWGWGPWLRYLSLSCSIPSLQWCTIPLHICL